MKKVWTYFAIGCVVAIIGMFFSDICGDFFNGMDYGSACVLVKFTDEREITSARLHLVAQNLRTLYFLIRYSGGGCQFDIIFL